VRFGYEYYERHQTITDKKMAIYINFLEEEEILVKNTFPRTTLYFDELCDYLVIKEFVEADLQTINELISVSQDLIPNRPYTKLENPWDGIYKSCYYKGVTFTYLNHTNEPLLRSLLKGDKYPVIYFHAHPDFADWAHTTLRFYFNMHPYINNTEPDNGYLDRLVWRYKKLCIKDIDALHKREFEKNNKKKFLFFFSSFTLKDIIRWLKNIKYFFSH